MWPVVVYFVAAPRQGAIFSFLGGRKMRRLLPCSRRLHLRLSRHTLPAVLPLVLLYCTMVLVAGFSTTAAAGQGATQAAARPMTVDDALRLVRLGDVLISPDGTQVFYSASELD
ncbi:MAG TPA: hypothetical protein DIU48_13360 [Acidobacteria bacterium]|nr:hypothetical protein [Acidobacteriota bacterium]